MLRGIISHSIFCRLPTAKQDLGLAADFPCVVIMDSWYVHKGKPFLDHLAANHKVHLASS